MRITTDKSKMRMKDMEKRKNLIKKNIIKSPKMMVNLEVNKPEAKEIITAIKVHINKNKITLNQLNTQKVNSNIEISLTSMGINNHTLNRVTRKRTRIIRKRKTTIKNHTIQIQIKLKGLKTQ